MTNHLLWLDLETTGTDETKDSIIEIGCVLTTEDLEEVDEFAAIVRPTDEALGRLLRNDVVRQMHDANGLLGRLIPGAAMSPTFMKPHEVAVDLLQWLEEHAEGERVALAGSGVAHFDRRFLARWMPQLDRRLTYWSIDIGVVRRAHQMWAGDLPSADNESKTHRALDDARCHLAEARAFRALWSAGT